MRLNFILFLLIQVLFASAQNNGSQTKAVKGFSNFQKSNSALQKRNLANQNTVCSSDYHVSEENIRKYKS